MKESRFAHRSARCVSFGIALCAAFSVFGQVQNHYIASNATGQLVLTRTVNLSQVQATQGALGSVRAQTRLETGFGDVFPYGLGSEMPTRPARLSRLRRLGSPTHFGVTRPGARSLVVGGTTSVFGFNAISHYDQRNAASGNQFSIEPPSPSLAVGNGYVLEGVNNAVRIFSTTGTPLIGTLSSSQLFGLPPAIDRTTGIYGPYLTDMRVYFDHDISRWLVLQRSQDNDAYGNPLNSSHIYLAVSQSADPTASWSIYVMDTTNAQNRGCPCLSDYPQIGSDQFGFYISADEYDTTYLAPVDATILAISKAALSIGGAAPTVYRFTLSRTLGYEFAIQPATTPPSASNLLASGGVEYFVSSQATYAVDSNLAIWALSNTASLQGQSTSLLLTQTTVPLTLGGNELSYAYPDIATQPPGALPLGSTIESPPQLPFLDGGPDSRVQSVSYAGGRLFVTLPSQVLDDLGNGVVGAIYAVLSPTFRGNILAASVVKQGYLSVRGNHILRPALSVDAMGRGAIAFTLSGPNYYPSAALAAFATTIPNTGIIDPTPPAAVVVAGAGSLPEDGFTAYPPEPTAPVARWGDYSTAVTSTDGSIWMVTEYIPNGPRTQYANWGTYISQYVPAP
jgi:hypothetical protein